MALRQQNATVVARCGPLWFLVVAREANATETVGFKANLQVVFKLFLTANLTQISKLSR